MDVKYINPFIESTINCIEMMTGHSPQREQPFVKEGDMSHGDITGMIGFAAQNITGSVAVTFPRESALSIYNDMTGESVSVINREVQDSVGELANIIAGGAKSILAEQGLSYHISIPTVIVGKNHHIQHRSNTPVVVIPFSFNNMRIVVEVAMRLTGKTK